MWSSKILNETGIKYYGIILKGWIYKQPEEQYLHSNKNYMAETPQKKFKESCIQWGGVREKQDSVLPWCGGIYYKNYEIRWYRACIKIYGIIFNPRQYRSSQAYIWNLHR